MIDNKDSRKVVFAEVKKELDAGGRAFIVYPLREPALVDEEDSDLDEPGTASKGLDLRSAEQEFAKLKKSKAFGKHGCALLHGQMSSAEKAAAIASFRDGTTPALVCTVVVEVGVDVSEASIIVVEHADRFGLAQLHQLRGRVGRGSRQSQCFLLSPAKAEQPLERLQVLESCHNGFEIAEFDLKFRGAGQVFGSGTRQSGGLDVSELCQREIAADASIVEGARRAAALTLAMQQQGQGQGVAPAGSAVPTELASVAAAFKAAVKRKARAPSFFGEDSDEEGDADEGEELLGIAV